MRVTSATRIEVVNRQRKREIDLRRWAEYGRDALAAIRHAEGATTPAGSDTVGTREAGSCATVAFVGDQAIRRLNREFRGKNSVTDVLSFPRGEEEFERGAGAGDLGDVIICVPQAERQAAANGLAFEEEIGQLVLHGLLHLCGYDHATDAGEMNRLELRLRHLLGVG